jgi:hypothetical protein
MPKKTALLPRRMRRTTLATLTGMALVAAALKKIRHN